MDRVSAARREIIREFLTIRRERAITGSELNRVIAVRIGLKVNDNGDNTFVRRVLKEYMASMR